ncbi:MAG: class glutamine amidotransferase [Vampirovibrio sp.]|nr:class glutamine amidotransferase [Vampirovibrio sp.]
MSQLSPIQSRVFAAQSRPLSTRLHSPSPRFGCRLTGAMSTTGSTDGDQFVKSMTVNLPEIADKKHALTEGVHAAAALLRNDQSHGWGYAHFTVSQSPGTGITLKQFKSPLSILRDPQYQAQRRSFQTDTLSSGIAHVRKATGGTDIRKENAHPFSLKLDNTEWTFVHNGRWDNALSPAIQARLKQDPVFTPKGTTDSEHAFLALMQAIRTQLGTLNTEQVGQDKMTRAFADGIRQLTQEPSPFVTATIPDSNLKIGGKVRVGPAYNFVANDGDLMIAYRNGQSLYLGVQRDDKGKVVAHGVATEPTALPGVVWFDVPENTLVVISKQKTTGQSAAQVLPLESISPLKKDSYPQMFYKFLQRFSAS